MDGPSTIALIVGVITCVIGVLSFVSARISKAEQDGRFAEKLDNCVKGISEIKATMQSHSMTQNQQDVRLSEHEQRIKSLEARMRVVERSEKE